MAEIVEKGVDAAELARAKTRLIADTVYAQDSQASLARIYGSALATGGTVEAVRQLAGRHRGRHGRGRAATPPRRWLDRRRTVTGYLIKDEAA